MVSLAQQQLLRAGILKAGDVLGVVAGTRQSSGSTNFMRLHSVSPEEANAASQEPARKSARKKMRPPRRLAL